jgi:hypothetical protein
VTRGVPVKEKPCKKCGDEFLPRGNRQVYCDDCRPPIVRAAASDKPKRRPPKRRVEEAIRSRVAAHADERLRRIDEESFRRFRK